MIKSVLYTTPVSDSFRDALKKVVGGKTEETIVMVEEEELEPIGLEESGLARIYSKVKDHVTGAITGFRSSRTRNENRAINKQILAYLLSKGYSVTKVKGAYVENYGKDGEKEVGEESFFVANEKVFGADDKDLEADLVALGQKYDQDSVLIVRDGKGELIGTSNRDNAWPSFGERVPVGQGKFGKAAGQFFSRVKGRQFAFEEVSEVPMPETINGIRAMKIMAEQVEEALRENNNNK